MIEPAVVLMLLVIIVCSGRAHEALRRVRVFLEFLTELHEAHATVSHTGDGCMASMRLIIAKEA